MTVNELLITLTRVSFVILAALTMTDYVIRRDRIRRDIALGFLALTGSTLITIFQGMLGTNLTWLTRLGQLGVLAQPYMLLRLVKYFRPLPLLVERGVLAGLIVSWLTIIFSTPPLPPVLTLLIITYFCVGNGYAVIAFIEGAFSSAGVTRLRLRLVATGSMLLVFIMVIAGLRLAFPTIWGDITPYVQSLSILSALAYYLGFATPRWLRQSWQLAELRTYLLEAVPGGGKNPARDFLNRLRRSVARATGTEKVIIALWHQDSEKLIPDEPAKFAERAFQHEWFDVKAEGVIRQVWEDGAPVVAYVSAGMNDHDRQLMQFFDAETLFLVPIATRERSLGLLLVFLEHGSLFPEDDLNLLTIFAQHTAIILENDAILEQLRRYTEDLERQVQQRTAALQRSNEELGQFAYVASHDLREPLRTVTSYLQLLKERYGGRLDSDADEFIAFAVEGSLRMKDLIDGLLAYSRVETLRQNFTTIDIQKILDDIHKLMKVAIDESGAVITTDSLPPIRGDERLIRQLFQNLISNAIKYQNGNKPEIHISASISSDMWEFALRDNGIGIEPQYLERIFVIFQRLHNRSQYPGAGIGLAICRKVVEHHGGRIRAESVKGSGTTFYFTLPGLDYQPQFHGHTGIIDVDDFGTSTAI